MEGIFLYKIILTILFGMLLGLVSSIPVGAVQLEVIKKTINGHIKPAIAIACGSATSDFIYGILTLRLRPFYHEQAVPGCHIFPGHTRVVVSSVPRGA